MTTTTPDAQTTNITALAAATPSDALAMAQFKADRAARRRAMVSLFVRKLAVSTVLVLIGYWAFRLVFSHQTQLAIGAGMPSTEAWQYPLVVEAGAVGLFLVRIWWPTMSPAISRYLWLAIAFFTIVSVIGNASFVLVAEPGTITLPQGLAIFVNSIPSLTLFLVGHIAVTVVFPHQRADASAGSRGRALSAHVAARVWRAIRNVAAEAPAAESSAPKRKSASSTPTAPSSPRPAAAPRPTLEGIPTGAELLARNEAGETLLMLEASLGGARKKSWIAEEIKAARAARDAERGGVEEERAAA